MSAGPASLRAHLGVLAALLALLLATAGLALLPLGRFNTVAALSISAAKAALVMAFFMRLRGGHPFLRVVALAGFAWLALLLGLSLCDYATRAWLPAPW